ncbi:MAG: patatin family protein [Reinekea sp.]|jgi:predicted patatin/cPLA2 family phospholipase
MTRHTHALIVEGGAMRGIFAAGVLDSFLDNQFRPFDVCMGVSAGSTNLAGFLAGQRGRSHKLITDYSRRKDFINPWKYLRGGHYLDLDWLWEVADKEYPLNAKACIASGIPLWIVTTNATTGEANYHLPNEHNLIDLLLASCALPMVYRTPPIIDGEIHADGGVADSVPVLEAYHRGARNMTVILSRPQGYRMPKKRVTAIVKLLLAHYPQLVEATIKRHINYNKSMDFIDHPPADCTVHVLAPDSAFDVARTTTDLNKLEAGYEMGLRTGREFAAGYYVPHNSIENRQRPFDKIKT